MIYGYMQISEIIYTNKTQVPDWLQYHPHVNKDKINDPNNCIYVGAQTLSWNSKIKGYGVFDNFDESLVLTKDGMSRSKWKLPYIFKNTLITYHNDGSWKEDYFQSAYRGQEFVCQENSKISEWSKNIIENNAT